MAVMPLAYGGPSTRRRIHFGDAFSVLARYILISRKHECMSIPHYGPLFRLLGATVLFALVTFSARAHQVDPAGVSQATLAASVVTGTGTVAELIVDNRVTNVTRRYLALRLDDGHTVALTGSGLDALASGARVEVTGSLSADTLAVASFNVLSSSQGASKAGALRKQVQ